MEASPPARTPGLLKLVGWLTILSGMLQVAAGALILIFRDDILDNVSEYSSDELTAFACAAIVVGVLYLLVGRGFLRLNILALSIGLALSVLAIIGDVIFLVTNAGHAGIIVSLILNVIVLIAVCSGFSARDARP